MRTPHNIFWDVNSFCPRCHKHFVHCYCGINAEGEEKEDHDEKENHEKGGKCAEEQPD